MRAFLLPFLLLFLTAASPADLSRWKAQAERVTIVRDDWGIAHVEGRTDADAVFGMIYAQAEDDFPRIEANYLTALGRTAEAEGETAIWKDLRARLYVSDEKLKADFERSPDWLKRLMQAWADGLNFYLATHPEVRPRVITRFEPWMALSFTEGSIGGDIERIDLGELQTFYSMSSSPRFRGEVAIRRIDGGAPPPNFVRSPSPANAREDVSLEGQNSNGIAIAPGLTAGGHSLLLINPHTSFFFRSEAQVKSGEGLNAYGAATWGQFFIYQGFNPNAGWMHTSSGVDVVDEFALEIRWPELGPRYRFGKEWRPFDERVVTIRYRTADGSMAERSFTTWHSVHGPVVRSKDGKWIAYAMMDKPVEALQQSFLRTKASDLASYLKVGELKANSSNNTVFASSKGEIAYLHPQFVPRRDDRFDYTQPVDGSDPASAWNGLHELSELPSVINPPNGWVQNTNTWPYRAAGAAGPPQAGYPRYMDMFGPNYREEHALRLLEGSEGWTLGKLRAAAFDAHQPGFAALVPQLVASFDALARGDPRRRELAAPVGLLRRWDYRWSASSPAQTLAMFWGRSLYAMLDSTPAEPTNRKYMRLGRDTTADQKLEALTKALAWLRRDFGSWRVPWAEVNRFQRISPAIDHVFSDDDASTPVPFADGNFGSLASFRSEPRNGSKRWYGYHGNSFVAVVEFGPRVSGVAVKAGGQSGDPSSPHFTDQAARYASGDLRPVYFYPDQLQGHIERTYRPGE